MAQLSHTPSLSAQKTNVPLALAPVQLLPRPDVLARIGLKTTKLYEMMNEGAFPRPIKIGRRCLWPSAAVDAWIAEQIEAFNGEGA